jgi:hypothetical protein
MIRLIVSAFLTLVSALVSAQHTLRFDVPAQETSNPVLMRTLVDVTRLLSASDSMLRFVATKADRTLSFRIDTSIPEDFPVFHYPNDGYPDHSYRIEGNDSGWVIRARNVMGLHFGAYGWLQEFLGFRFYHPKESIIPNYHAGLPMPKKETDTYSPVFVKKGFHLHTMHPLELTEQLHNPLSTNALEDIKEYIDWLARNGQNYFDFSLMRTVNEKLFIRHARQFVEYAHSRGVMVGLELSLHMIQQRVYQMVQFRPWSFTSYKKQIDKELAWVFEAPWDFINLDLTSAEFVGGMDKKKNELKNYLVQTIRGKYKSGVLLRKHVVNEENHVGKVSSLYDVRSEEDTHIGILLHTVMFYSLTDPKARVYENENFNHVLKDLVNEARRRDTWYYPESAYWITFDNSVPMFLMPYLTGRYNDIRTCDSIGVPNHTTFSSGWEWGYWLFDWSIAQWSWKRNSRLKPADEPFRLLLNDTVQASRWMHILHLQNTYLNEKELMQYMCPFTVTDELPKFIRKEFQPRPYWQYSQLKKGSDSLHHALKTIVLPELNAFADQSESLLSRTAPGQLQVEWSDGIRITALRARHKACTIGAILYPEDRDSLLYRASAIRAEALKIVKQRELSYRYPREWIVDKHDSYTAYPYGYLYMVSNLHFWKREEDQVKHKRFDVFFRNVWPVGKILGLD